MPISLWTWIKVAILWHYDELIRKGRWWLRGLCIASYHDWRAPGSIVRTCMNCKLKQQLIFGSKGQWRTLDQ